MRAYSYFKGWVFLTCIILNGKLRLLVFHAKLEANSAILDPASLLDLHFSSELN